MKKTHQLDPRYYSTIETLLWFRNLDTVLNAHEGMTGAMKSHAVQQAREKEEARAKFRLLVGGVDGD